MRPRGFVVVRAGVSAVALVVLIAAGGCKKREPTTTAPAPLPVPARPAEVLAELCLPRPSELWPALQALLGPPVTFLPKAPELGLGGWLSLSPLVSSSLDLRAPLVAVALAGTEPALLFGVHLENGPEFVAQLTTGNAPTHRAQRESGLTWLTARKPEGAQTLAVAGDALVIGPRAGIARAGTYVARSLLPQAATKGPVTAFVPGEALRAVGVPALRALWDKRRAALLEAQRRAEAEHGRPADFGDPALILAGVDDLLESTLALLSSTSRITAELSLEPQGLEVVLRAWPEPSGAVDKLARSLSLGAGDALQALPASTVLALLLRRNPEAPSLEYARAVRALLGPRLSESDERALREALSSLDAGRGNLQMLGVLDDLSLVWRGEVKDAALMRRGLAQLAPWFTRPSVVGSVTALLGRPLLSQSTQSVPGSAVPAQRASFRMVPAAVPGKKPAAPRQFEVLSLVDPTRFVVAAGGGRSAPLGAALSAERGEGSLAANEQLAGWLGRRKQVAGLAFADVGRVSAAFGGGAASSAPLLLELSAREGGPELGLKVSAGALRALLSWAVRP